MLWVERRGEERCLVSVKSILKMVVMKMAMVLYDVHGYGSAVAAPI